MDSRPTVPYWQLWTDTAGISHQTCSALTEFELKSMQPPADPQWQARHQNCAMTWLITVQPVDWVGTWHQNPTSQWIVPLSGRWFVESMDGERVEMGSGEISFGGDQGCRTIDGKRGHRSGTVGDVPAVLMVVQFHDRFMAATECAFR